MAKRPGLRRAKKRNYGLVLCWLLVLGALCWGGRWLIVSFDLQTKISTLLQDDSASQARELLRGTIFDRNYKELAVSLERVSVYVRIREIHSPEEIAAHLAPVLSRTESDLLARINSGGLRSWIARNISQEQEETIRNLRLPGVYLARDYLRFYPQEDTAAHIVGFAADGLGLGGAESYYDRLLSQVLAKKSGPLEWGVAGQHLLLTVDLKIQQVLEDLIAQLSAPRPEAKIGLYVMDSTSGAIVGAAQRPSFNPNRYRLYEQDVLESLLVQPMVLPGLYRSFLRAATQLEAEHRRQKTVLPWSLTLFPGNLGGELQMWQALGLADGPSEEFMIAPGVGAMSGEYPEDASSQGDFGTAPVMLAPLDLLSALSSLLNGGTLITAHVAHAVVDPDSGAEHLLRGDRARQEQRVVDQKISEELGQLASSLSVANSLGAVCWQDESTVFLKRGEQRRIVQNKLLFGAFPSPGAELTMLLTIQNSVVPGPVDNRQQRIEAQSLFLEALPRVIALQQVGKGLQMVAEPGEEQRRNFPSGIADVVDREAQRAETDGGIPPGFMPDIVGLSLRKGLRLLQERKCQVQIYGTGRIISQEPPAGTRLGDDVECVLRLERGNGKVELFSEQSGN